MSKRAKLLNPLEREAEIPDLQPIQRVLDDKLKRWQDQQGKIIAYDPVLTKDQKKARLMALEFHSNINRETEFLTNEKKEFVLDFIDWLNYRDPTNAKDPRYVRDTEQALGKLGATVRTEPLDVQGKNEWLGEFIDKKSKFNRAILRLRLGPHSTHTWDLYDAYLYYKYILRGEKCPDNGFLDDFDNYFMHKWKPDPNPRPMGPSGGWDKGYGRYGGDPDEGGGQERADEEFIPSSKGPMPGMKPEEYQQPNEPGEDAKQEMEIKKEKIEEQEEFMNEGEVEDNNGVAPPPDDASDDAVKGITPEQIKEIIADVNKGITEKIGSLDDTIKTLEKQTNEDMIKLAMFVDTTMATAMDNFAQMIKSMQGLQPPPPAPGAVAPSASPVDLDPILTRLGDLEKKLMDKLGQQPPAPPAPPPSSSPAQQEPNQYQKEIVRLLKEGALKKGSGTAPPPPSQPPPPPPDVSKDIAAITTKLNDIMTMMKQNQDQSQVVSPPAAAPPAAAPPEAPSMDLTNIETGLGTLTTKVDAIIDDIQNSAKDASMANITASGLTNAIAATQGMIKKLEEKIDKMPGTVADSMSPPAPVEPLDLSQLATKEDIQGIRETLTKIQTEIQTAPQSPDIDKIAQQINALSTEQAQEVAEATARSMIRQGVNGEELNKLANSLAAKNAESADKLMKAITDDFNTQYMARLKELQEAIKAHSDALTNMQNMYQSDLNTMSEGAKNDLVAFARDTEAAVNQLRNFTNYTMTQMRGLSNGFSPSNAALHQVIKDLDDLNTNVTKVQSGLNNGTLVSDGPSKTALAQAATIYTLNKLAGFWQGTKTVGSATGSAIGTVASGTVSALGYGAQGTVSAIKGTASGIATVASGTASVLGAVGAGGKNIIDYVSKTQVPSLSGMLPNISMPIFNNGETSIATAEFDAKNITAARNGNNPIIQQAKDNTAKRIRENPNNRIDVGEDVASNVVKIVSDGRIKDSGAVTGYLGTVADTGTTTTTDVWLSENSKNNKALQRGTGFGAPMPPSTPVANTPTTTTTTTTTSSSRQPNATPTTSEAEAYVKRRWKELNIDGNPHDDLWKGGRTWQQIDSKLGQFHKKKNLDDATETAKIEVTRLRQVYRNAKEMMPDSVFSVKVAVNLLTRSIIDIDDESTKTQILDQVKQLQKNLTPMITQNTEFLKQATLISEWLIKKTNGRKDFGSGITISPLSVQIGIRLLDAYLDTQTNVTEAILKSRFKSSPETLKEFQQRDTESSAEPTTEEMIQKLFYKPDSRGRNMPIFKGGMVAYLRIAAAYMDELIKSGGSVESLTTIQEQYEKDIGNIDEIDTTMLRDRTRSKRRR